MPAILRQKYEYRGAGYKQITYPFELFSTIGCGDELARTALYEAAHSLLIRSTKWSALRAWGMQVAKRRGMARARVAVARKLAVVLHRMWVDKSEFRWGTQAVAV